MTTLVIIAHPSMEESMINKHLKQTILNETDITYMKNIRMNKLILNMSSFY
ncbi:hypothetical protein [Piscibacillus halophilus]|uniref:hypothetical protein n=1 Tax=Piscibacillus halophilus TaxID=571933 RepID=UPI00158A5FE7|nr:hypothetical protein [Piscibacillus halophilus]